MKSYLYHLLGLTFIVSLAGCGKETTSTAKGDRTANALASYVAPGERDEYYLFYSGGHSGQVYVAGIPSMWHISTIPVFAPYPATGYGFLRLVWRWGSSPRVCSLEWNASRAAVGSLISGESKWTFRLIILA